MARSSGSGPYAPTLAMTTAGLKSGNKLVQAKSNALTRAMFSETVMAAPPTVTIGTSTSAIASSALTAFNAARLPFRYEHAWATRTVGTNYLSPAHTTYNDGTTDSYYSPWRIAFDTDAPKFEFRTFSYPGTEFRIWVNEQLVRTATFTTAGDSADILVLVDFTAVGGRQYRRIVIEMNGGAGGVNHQGVFGGVRCVATDTLQYPTIPDGPTFAIFGDSYAEGVLDASNGYSSLGYPSRLARYLGFPNSKLLAASGTGFLKDNGQFLHYIGRIADLQAVNPDIILLQSSLNDSSVYVAGTVQTAVTAFINATRVFAPVAPLFVTGVLRVANQVGNDAAVEAEVLAAVTALQATDTNLYYINLRPAGVPVWFNGTGHVGATNGNGTADFLLASDAVHPTDEGHLQVAIHIGSEIAKVLAIGQQGGTANPVTDQFVPKSWQQFTTSGTYTVPANVTKLRILCVGGGSGGGGGGGATNVATQVGGGGGGAGAASIQEVAATPGDVLTVTVGAGGAAGTAGGVSGAGGNGGSGGNTTVTGTGISVAGKASVLGGRAGGANSTTQANGGCWGSANSSTTTSNLPGVGGPSASTGGQLGGSPFSYSGGGGGGGGPANTATAGGGGGGAGSAITNGAAGGNASSGTVNGVDGSAAAANTGAGGGGGGGGSATGTGGAGGAGGSGFAIIEAVG